MKLLKLKQSKISDNVGCFYGKYIVRYIANNYPISRKVFVDLGIKYKNIYP